MDLDVALSPSHHPVRPPTGAAAQSGIRCEVRGQSSDGPMCRSGSEPSRPPRPCSFSPIPVRAPGRTPASHRGDFEQWSRCGGRCSWSRCCAVAAARRDWGASATSRSLGRLTGGALENRCRNAVAVITDITTTGVHMTLGLSRQRLALLLVGALMTLCIVSALSSSSASASPFCGGLSVNNINKCWGAARSLRGDTGNGSSTSICIGIDLINGPCSSGPGAVATLDLGAYGEHAPWIIGNARTFTVVHGETF